MNMKDVLSHPLGPLPWALANADGPYEKTHKAALATELEKNLSPAEAITTPSTCIIDGMGLVQRTNGNNNTFAQLVESVLSRIQYVGGQRGRVDVIFDVCHQPSINDSETDVQAQPFGINAWQGAHNIHQWRKCLCSSFNKTSSYWLASGNYSDTEICCKTRHCV